MRAEARGSLLSGLFFIDIDLSRAFCQGAFGGQWNARRNGMHLHNDPTNPDRMSRLRCDQSARINRVSMIERGSRERCVRSCVPLFFLFDQEPAIRGNASNRRGSAERCGGTFTTVFVKCERNGRLPTTLL